MPRRDAVGAPAIVGLFSTNAARAPARRALAAVREGNVIIRQTYAKFNDVDCLIDAHIHFWDPARHEHQWLREVPELDVPRLPSDIEFGPRIPDGFVFVEADRASHQALSEVQWVASLSSQVVPIVGIVAHAPLHEGARVESQLSRLSQEQLVVGVRRLLQGEPPALLDAPELVEGTRLLATYGLTSDLCVTWEQLPAVTRLVRACPETHFVLDHLGKPAVGKRVLEPWRSDLRELAACSNVACKLSGLATLAPHGSDRTAVIRYLEEALDAFGPERCMFGSDWPVSLLNTTYESWMETVFEVVGELAPLELAGVLGGNAIRVYGLGTVARRAESSCA